MNREPRGGASSLPRLGIVAISLVLGAVALGLISPGMAGAADALPAGFREEIVFEGLNNPTNVEFADDGRVFVAEKSGVIKVFDDLSDTTPTTFADLRTEVYNYWDRGLLGLALDPDFPREPYVYALYTYDAEPGGGAPRWGVPGEDSDQCPSPPGPMEDGCVVTGHLSRLQADVEENTMVGEEDVLIEDWCQQYPSHTIGDLAFGKDGALYVSAGDGASFSFADYGQEGEPTNPCGDPPGGVGATLRPPTAEGGALRSQDLRTSGDPVSLDGAILRVNPTTGAAMTGNPLIGNTDLNARRIVAYGLRNPFRFAIRPGTSEVWLGDVGWNTWEEINRVANPTGPVRNFGWPCYEGNGRQAGYDDANLNICETLYTAGASATARPYFAYDHGPQTNCGTGGASISGLAFYEGGTYPDSYDGALFYTDFSRNCIWVIKRGTNGLPSPSKRQAFVTGAAGPVYLEIGPGGDLFYVDLVGGTIRRIEYSAGNQPPIARATASPTSGQTPLEVRFDGTGSNDPNGEAISYAWDLDGDGAYDDSNEPKPTYTYTAERTYRVQLKVTDSRGAADTLDRPLEISAGGTSPQATIDSPLSTLRWKVGDEISFSGSATDQQDGAIPASGLSWSLIMHHCSPNNASSCHEHTIEDFRNVATGSFRAPDHEYPSYLELRLTATDSDGLTDTRTVRLDPQTMVMNFRSGPKGMKLVVGSERSKAPFSRTVIVGSKNSISAPSSAKLRGKKYRFRKWSDGESRVHQIVAPDAPSITYKATYKRKR